MSFLSLQDVSEALAWTLVHFLWQGMLVGLLYGIARRLASDVRWQYRFALAALVLLLALPAATFYAEITTPQTTTVAGVEAAASAAPAGNPAIAATGAVTAGDAVDPAWTNVLVAFWLIGALLIAARLFGDWRLIRTAIREGAQPPEALSALLKEQLRRIGISRPVRMVLTARITTPGVYGLIRPVVLLPVALALGMPRDQLETLLIHELAHIRRADFIGNLLAIAARTLFYFHPIVHWICRDLERSRETLCDDLVVGLDVDRIKYARALSTAEEFRQQVPAPLLTATGGVLTWRVHRILALDTDTRKKGDRAPLFLAIAAIAVSIAGLNSMTSEHLANAARPNFRTAYGALMAITTPGISVPDRASNIQPLELPRIAVEDDPAPTVTPDTIPVDSSGHMSIDEPASAIPQPASTTLVPEGVRHSTIAFDPLATIEQPALTSVAPVPATAPESEETIRKQPTRMAIERVQPDYPRNARWAGTEGSVTVTYRVDAAGKPVDVRIASAHPTGVFEEATLEAFRHWRFEPGSGAESAQQSQIFDFSLGKDADARCKVRLGSKICQR
jgi:TonB family protein